MIGYLRGKLRARAADRVVIDAGGVGYDVAISLTSFAELQKSALGDEVELHVHTHVREDVAGALRLRDAAREAAVREADRRLGDRPAARAGRPLRACSRTTSSRALAAGDVARLVRIPGVGKKTAERMVVELRDKVQALAAELPAAKAADRRRLRLRPRGGAGQSRLQAGAGRGRRRRGAEGSAGGAVRRAPPPGAAPTVASLSARKAAVVPAAVELVSCSKAAAIRAAS